MPEKGHRFSRLKVDVYLSELPRPEPPVLQRYRMVADAPVIVIIGAGPAGYFAALECLEMGYRPIIYERGKEVRQRRRDLKEHSTI